MERLDLPEPVVYLYLPEALNDPAAYRVGGNGRIERVPRGTEAREQTGWTLADLTRADAAAWDDAVTRLGGKPWIPEDGMLSTGESADDRAGEP